MFPIISFILFSPIGCTLNNTLIVQHSFGGVWDESKNIGEMRDGRNFNSGMQDEKRTAGPGFAAFFRRDRG